MQTKVELLREGAVRLFLGGRGIGGTMVLIAYFQPNQDAKNLLCLEKSKKLR